MERVGELIVNIIVNGYKATKEERAAIIRRINEHERMVMTLPHGEPKTMELIRIQNLKNKINGISSSSSNRSRSKLSRYGNSKGQG